LEGISVAVFEIVEAYSTFAFVVTGDVPIFGWAFQGQQASQMKLHTGLDVMPCAEGKDLKVRFADIGCGFGGLIGTCLR